LLFSVHAVAQTLVCFAKDVSDKSKDCKTQGMCTIFCVFLKDRKKGAFPIKNFIKNL